MDEYTRMVYELATIHDRPPMRQERLSWVFDAMSGDGESAPYDSHAFGLVTYIYEGSGWVWDRYTPQVTSVVIRKVVP